MRMASRYGHTWVSQYGPMPDGIAAAEWRSTLAGLTAEQMREGFAADASRGAEWPPSSPSLRAMCFGIPSLGSVRAEIDDMLRYSSRGQGSLMSRFARGTWGRIDSYGYRNATGKTPERMLREAYELTREFVMDGGTLPVNPVALVEHTKPERKPASPEVVKEHIDRMRDILREPETEADHDSAA